MRHFSVLFEVKAFLNFPPSWGSPLTDVKTAKGEKDSFNNVIWKLWSDRIAEAMQPNGQSQFFGLGLPTIKDTTAGYDYDGVAFSIESFHSEEHLETAVDWCIKQLEISYSLVVRDNRTLFRRRKRIYQPSDMPIGKEGIVLDAWCAGKKVKRTDEGLLFVDVTNDIKRLSLESAVEIVIL